MKNCFPSQPQLSSSVDGVEELKIEISKSSPHSRFTMRKLLLLRREREIELKVFFNRTKSFKKKLVFVYFLISHLVARRDWGKTCKANIHLLKIQFPFQLSNWLINSFLGSRDDVLIAGYLMRLSNDTKETFPHSNRHFTKQFAIHRKISLFSSLSYAKKETQNFIRCCIIFYAI